MIGWSYLQKLSIAVGLSTVCIVGTAAIQGIVFFPHMLSSFFDSRRCRIMNFTCTSDRRAVVSFAVEPAIELVGPKQMVGMYDFTAHPPKVRAFVPEVTPELTACAKRGERFFMATFEGGLYSLDVSAQRNKLSLVGAPTGHCPQFLECSEDGSAVAMAAGSGMVAWQDLTLAWKRLDLEPTCGHFVPGSRRFLCGLNTGEVLELDMSSGNTARTFASHASPVKGLHVSRCGSYLASIDCHGGLILTDFRNGRVLWTKICHELNSEFKGPIPHRGLHFTPDGSALVVPYVTQSAQLLLVVHHSFSGEAILRLTGDTDYVKGLDVDENRIVYAWCVSGNIVAWDMISGTKIYQSTPTRDLAQQRIGLRTYIFGEI